MADADSIARLYADQESTTARFRMMNNATEIGVNNVAGTWSASGGTITWEGTDPEFTASSSVTVNKLQVMYAVPVVWAGVVANGSHAPVPLQDGEKIVYTSIQISFTTPDL